MIDYSKVTLIIPAYNEEAGITDTIRGVLSLIPSIKIIVINDGSTDGTSKALETLTGLVQVIEHKINRGYGASLKTGMKNSTTEYVVWYDADGQHFSEDIESIVEPVYNNSCDANFGARSLKQSFILLRAPGKFILKFISEIVARRRIPDLNCGFRCFKLSVIKKYLHLLPNGFSASTTSTLLIIKRGYILNYTKVRTGPRTGTSSVSILRDGFNTLKLIFKIMILFDASLFFAIPALFLIFVGVFYSFYILLTLKNGFPTLGALTITTGLLMFFMGVISSQLSELRQERFEDDT